MKRVRRITATVPDSYGVKITVEVTTARKSTWDRPSFINKSDEIASEVMGALHRLGLRLTHIKVK